MSASLLYPVALVVVDMQRYYLEPESAFVRFHQHEDPGCLDYIHHRCRETVLPNTERLLAAFRSLSYPVIFLKLAGNEPDRSDLHPAFRDIHRLAAREGTEGLYPLVLDPMADIHPNLTPLPGECVYVKTTYSAFTSTPIHQDLRGQGHNTLVFAGLATSQCVESTARDAADRSFKVIHVEDAQADYSETTHYASLHASRGVCGGEIVCTETLLDLLERDRLRSRISK